MIRYIIILLLSFTGSGHLCAQASDLQTTTPDFTLLYNLAGKNLIFSSEISEDSLIQLSSRLESEAYAKKDYYNYFRTGQIKVNAYCLKGDIGLAINEAEILYERAKTADSALGMVLALQAVGDTYMYSDQPNQAFSTFKEAEQRLGNEADHSIRLRLYLQIIHVCWTLNDMASMRTYLQQLSAIMPRTDISNSVPKEPYAYYALCYEALMQTGMNKKEAVEAILPRLHDWSSTLDYKRWYYWVMAHYCGLKKEYDNALAFADSTVVEARKGGNLNEYRNAVIEKAYLLEKMQKDTQACDIYKEVNLLTDSLDMQRYARQIEHLHTVYLADQLKVENEKAHSILLMWLLFCCAVILLGGIALFLVVRRKNEMLVISRDKLAAVREETSRSIQSKSMFLSNMSHELRTPLNAIVGFSSILTSSDQIDEETKKQCGETIQQNADLLLKLIKDVMDFSELNINEIRYACNNCNAVTICRRVVDTVDKVKQTAAEVRFITSLDSLELYTDSGRLQQVLINLLVNATKFTKTGTITLSLALNEQQDEAVFAVEDTGCGIPLEKQPFIFQRFEKLNEGVQGFGLGLSISQLIVEHFGGKIWIDSSYTEGARFVFTHPLSSPNLQSL